MIRPRRAGVYVVKAAESPSTRVQARQGPGPQVTAADRQLARAVIKAKTR